MSALRRWKDWLRQSKRRLESAAWSAEGGFNEDACFGAEQAAELGARYPNGFGAGAPMDYYSHEQAQEAIGHARAVLEFVEREIARLLGE